MNPSTNDFLNMDCFSFEVPSPHSFETITHWMENRFTGLPLFHNSIDLKVIKHHRVIEKQKGRIAIPKEVEKIGLYHLVEDLDSLLAHINNKKGEKSLGLLHLKIKLVPRFLKEQLKHHSGPHKKLIHQLGSTISVPVILALVSRKTEKHYESLAFGIKGIGHYNSLLEVQKTNNDFNYRIKGGLHVLVEPKDIDHPFVKPILKYVKPGNLINEYLTQFLVPEKKEIITRLCAYTFNGCQMPQQNENLKGVESPTLTMAH